MTNKDRAKNRLMGAIADAISNDREDGDPVELVKEMRLQAIRVVKFLGFSSFPGICSKKED